MSPLVRAARLSIYLGNAVVYRHKALSTEILQRAYRAGLDGVTILQGVQGFGHSDKIHTTPTWGLLDRTPITVHIVDTPARIRAFLPQLEDIAALCLIVRDEVDVLRSEEGQHG